MCKKRYFVEGTRGLRVCLDLVLLVLHIVHTWVVISRLLISKKLKDVDRN